MRKSVAAAIALCMIMAVSCQSKDSGNKADSISQMSVSTEISAENLLSNSQASDILWQILNNNELKLMFLEDEEYLGESACSIKAYYDMGDYITTEGHYLILRETGRVFKLDNVGVDYYEITQTGQNNPFPEYESYMQNGRFEKALNNNHIDRDYIDTYNDTIYATADIVKREQRYIDLWQIEMDNALEILKKNLSSKESLEHLHENLPDEDAIQVLNESQKSWEQYMKNSICLGEDIHMASVGWGSEIQIFSASKILYMTRYRALELAEYCMQLTGEYNFMFQK